MAHLTCDWCGHAHAREALCAKRPTWGRRGFLALMVAGLAGLALPKVPLASDVMDFAWPNLGGDSIVAVVLYRDGEPLARKPVDLALGLNQINVELLRAPDDETIPLGQSLEAIREIDFGHGPKPVLSSGDLHAGAGDRLWYGNSLSINWPVTIT